MQNQDLYLTLRIFYKPLFYKSLRLLGYFSDNILFILFLNSVSKPNIFIKILFTAPYQNHSHVFLFFYEIFLLDLGYHYSLPGLLS